MKNRLFAAFLAALMLVTLLAPAAAAEETEETTAAAETAEETDATEESLPEIEAEHVSHETSGTCGDDITWELDGHTLRVTGSGKMKDGCPWEYYKDKIKKVVFSGGVTYVGAKAFLECENLVSINFGDAMHTIGEQAFKGCTDLVSISLPETFRKFGNSSFMDCTDLESIYCRGGMPSFQGGCLHTGNHIAIYTPLNNPWPQEAAQELMRNYGGRLEIVAGGGDTAPTEEEEEEPTTVPTEAPTEPETLPPTEPPTIPTAPPVTVPPTTVPPTEPAVTTEAVETTVETTEPEPRDMVEEVSNNSWIGMVIIAGVFTFLIVGALIFRISSRKGGRYTE